MGVLYDKGNDEEEYASPLKRESGCPDARKFSAEDGTLRGCLKEGLRKVASEPEDPESTGSCGCTGSPRDVSPHELFPLADRALTVCCIVTREVAENAGSDSGIKQRWYRDNDALCRQRPAGAYFIVLRICGTGDQNSMCASSAQKNF